MGGAQAHPIPNSFPQEKEAEAFSYDFFTTMRDEKTPAPAGRWTEDKSIDKRGEFTVQVQPGATMPDLGPARHLWAKGAGERRGRNAEQGIEHGKR